jgi:hypothetical protein
VAPYDTDHALAIEHAFDRETGQPIRSDQLKSYRQLLAQYHLQPEAKFLNGDYLDRGVTKRRYVHVAGIELMGKEANRWEEQFYLGLDDEAAVAYSADGLPQSLQAEFRRLSEIFGQRELADWLGRSRRGCAGKSGLGRPA